MAHEDTSTKVLTSLKKNSFLLKGRSEYSVQLGHALLGV